VKTTLYLTRHRSSAGPRWALDSRWLPPGLTLGSLLAMPRGDMEELLKGLATSARDSEPAEGPLLAPVEPDHEVWAAGVTYRRSRDARQVESQVADVYARVYQAPRPELFFKAIGWRVIGPDAAVRIRHDSRWTVPEPELTLVINCQGQIVGFCAGNDMSCRDIEGENPLYLPQAKIYDGSCALGPGILLAEPDALRDLPVSLQITRGGVCCFAGETRTSQMVRPLEELVSYLCRSLAFPAGVLLMTGTGIVPPDDFTLLPGDIIRIAVGTLVLTNKVQG